MSSDCKYLTGILTAMETTVALRKDHDKPQKVSQSFLWEMCACKKKSKATLKIESWLIHTQHSSGPMKLSTLCEAAESQELSLGGSVRIY